MQTKNLTLTIHVPRYLLALIESSEAYYKASGTPVADGVRNFLLAASSDFLAELQLSTVSDPWKFGFAIVQRQENVLIGLCGFTGPPDPGGAVEIAYSIAPNYQGKGYATEAATALVDYAFKSGRVKTVRAHTLPEFNASTRVLEKCGFIRIGEIVDLENNLVWRWERKRDASSASPYIYNHILKRSPR
jgi:RimJ/RimL family protein N-acetyltransferase